MSAGSLTRGLWVETMACSTACAAWQFGAPVFHSCTHPRQACPQCLWSGAGFSAKPCWFSSVLSVLVSPEQLARCISTLCS